MNVIAVVVMLLLMVVGVPLLGAVIIAGLGATGWILLRDLGEGRPEIESR